MVSQNENTSVHGERFAFSADIKKLMGLIINTFYSNKDVFLRELISNASDAIDKIKFQSLTDQSILGDDNEFKIEIIPDTEAKTITIRDNGIGMTKDDMIKNLGSIATSGTKSFMEAIKAGADIQMIGQFGVGFYSAFLVSKKVEVRSKHKDDTQHVWESAAGGEFDIYEDSKNDKQLKRGTEIILHLKDDQTDYLEERKIKEIIKKHSEFVGPKIFLWVRKEEEKEVTDDEADKIEEITDETETKKEEEVKKDVSKDDDEDSKTTKDGVQEEDGDSKMKIEEVTDDKGDDEKKEKKKKTKKVTEIKEEFVQVNENKPIWALNPKDVKKEDYNSFYKSISNDWEEPLAYKHFKVEGEFEFTGIIFIPKRTPFDLFNNQKKSNNIKLYVRRVFIHEESTDLCPDYLSFVRGVVDCEQIPLNISREMLQQNKVIKVINENIVKKTIELISEIEEDPEKFKVLYKNFSKNLKYGIHEDSSNRVKLADFLRYFTTKSEKETKSIKEYIAGMKEKQKDIYYITGESIEALNKLPYLERLVKKDFEVIYMTDPIDEYFVQQMSEYEGKSLVSVTKEGLELQLTEQEKAAFEQQKKDFEPFCKRMKDILGNVVEKVEVSNRMTDSPCYISTTRYGWSSRMEQIMKTQALRDTSFSAHMAAKKILVINPDNPIIKEMDRRFKDNQNDPVSKNLVHLIHDTALLTSSGFTLQKPMDYANRIYKLTKLGLNIVDEEDNEEIPSLEAVGEQDKKEENVLEEVD